MKRIFGVFILLFIFGCSLSNSGTKVEKELYKGNSGVVINLISALPEEVYEGETLNYIIKIENKGPYKVNNAKLLLSVEKGYMEFIDKTNVNEVRNINLEGKTLANTFDDFEVFEKSIKTKQIDEQSEYHDIMIMSNFCYDYEGIAIADICIDTDPNNLKSTDKLCNLKENIGLSGGQGGPLVITSIETRMLTDNEYIMPQFKVHFQNQGLGTVIKKGYVDQVCNKNPLESDVYNFISLRDISFSTYNKNHFECFPPELALRNEEDSITCTLKSGLISKNSPSYQTPLNIEIDYGYITSITKPIKIKKILKY